MCTRSRPSASDARPRYVQRSPIDDVEATWNARTGVPGNRVQLSVRAVPTAAGRSVLRDVRPRRHRPAGLQQQLLKSQKMEDVGRLAGVISRTTFKQPAHGDRATASCYSRISRPPIQRRMSKQVRKEADALRGAHSQLLAFSRQQQVVELRGRELHAVVDGPPEKSPPGPWAEGGGGGTSPSRTAPEPRWGAVRADVGQLEQCHESGGQRARCGC